MLVMICEVMYGVPVIAVVGMVVCCLETCDDVWASSQGWENYGPQAACGTPDHFMRIAGTSRNFYASLIVSVK